MASTAARSFPTAELAPVAAMEEGGPLLRGGPSAAAVAVERPPRLSTIAERTDAPTLEGPYGTAETDPTLHIVNSDMSEALAPSAWMIDDDFLDLRSPPDDGTDDDDDDDEDAFRLHHSSLVGTTTTIDFAAEGGSAFALPSSEPWDIVASDRPEHRHASRMSVDASIVSVDGSRSDAPDAASAASELLRDGPKRRCRPPGVPPMPWSDDDDDLLLQPSQDESARATTNRQREDLTTWYHTLRELREYRRTNGHCHVPQSYGTLGHWCNKQRTEKKYRDDGRPTQMTCRKVQALEHVGFEWAKPKGQASWMAHFDELVEFKRLHGHCNAPTRILQGCRGGGGNVQKYAMPPERLKALGRWITEQRTQKSRRGTGRRSLLTDDRIRLLDELGFCWERIQRPGRRRTSPRQTTSGCKSPAPRNV